MLAVLENWHGYVSGGILAFGLEISDRLWDWKPSKKLFIGILATGLAWSIFSAWREERKKAIKASQDLESLTKPNFELAAATITTVEMNIHSGPGAGSNTMVLMPTTIYNHGAPSIVKTYSMMLRFSGTEEYKGTSTVFQQPYIVLQTPKGPIQYPTHPSLMQKANSPIPTGGQADGLLVFVFPPGLTTKMNQPGSFFIFQVTDINDKTYKVEIPMSSTDVMTFTPTMVPTAPFDQSAQPKKQR